MTLELWVVLAAFGVWMYGLTDVLQARDVESRELDGAAWVPVVFFGFVFGAVGWLVLGRPSTGSPSGDHDSLGDLADAHPEAVEAFQRRLRARVEEQRRRYAEQSQDTP
jgi:hypothetical protein